MCVCHGICALIWRSQNNFVESVLSLHLYMDPGADLRLTGLYNNHLSP